MNDHNPNHPEHIGVFQVVVLFLSIIVLAALVADTAFTLPPQISRILQWLDTGVCILLLIDFCLRFYKAKSKLAFMKWGWIDLIASIPNLPVLRVGRLVRILRIIRLLRAIRATQRLSSILLRNKVQGGMASVFVTFVMLIVFSSIGILICEQQNPNANIKTAGDAVWWSVSTITTVGYGDVYPTTAEGRCLAMILMISGVGMFGLLSGIVASALMGAHQKETGEIKEITDWLKRLDAKLDALRQDKDPG